MRTKQGLTTQAHEGLNTKKNRRKGNKTNGQQASGNNDHRRQGQLHRTWRTEQNDLKHVRLQREHHHQDYCMGARNKKEGGQASTRSRNTTTTKHPLETTNKQHNHNGKASAKEGKGGKVSASRNEARAAKHPPAQRPKQGRQSASTKATKHPLKYDDVTREQSHMVDNTLEDSHPDRPPGNSTTSSEGILRQCPQEGLDALGAIVARPTHRT